MAEFSSGRGFFNLWFLNLWGWPSSCFQALCCSLPLNQHLSTLRWPDRGADPQLGLCFNIFPPTPSPAAVSAPYRLCCATQVGSTVVAFWVVWGGVFTKIKFLKHPQQCQQSHLFDLSCSHHWRAGRCSRPQYLWWSGKNVPQLVLPNYSLINRGTEPWANPGCHKREPGKGNGFHDLYCCQATEPGNAGRSHED